MNCPQIAFLAVQLAAVEPEVVVPLADLPEQAAGWVEAGQGGAETRLPRGEVSAVRFEPGIGLDEAGAVGVQLESGHVAPIIRAAGPVAKS